MDDGGLPLMADHSLISVAGGCGDPDSSSTLAMALYITGSGNDRGARMGLCGSPLPLCVSYPFVRLPTRTSSRMASSR